MCFGGSKKSNPAPPLPAPTAPPAVIPVRPPEPAPKEAQAAPTTAEARTTSDTTGLNIPMS